MRTALRLTNTDTGVGGLIVLPVCGLDQGQLPDGSATCVQDLRGSKQSSSGWSSLAPPPHGEKVAISRLILCHSSLVCFPLFRFCRTSLNCIIPTGVRQKAPRALRMMFTKSS